MNLVYSQILASRLLVEGFDQTLLLLVVHLLLNALFLWEVLVIVSLLRDVFNELLDVLDLPVDSLDRHLLVLEKEPCVHVHTIYPLLYEALEPVHPL